MAQDFLEEIYKISKEIFNLKKCVEIFYDGDGWVATQLWNANTQNMIEIIKDLSEIDKNLASKVQMACYKCRDKINNHLECAVIINDEFIPALYECLNVYGDIDVTEGDYRLCSAKSGLLTVQNINNGNYMHSPDDPLWEAYKRTEFIYRPIMQNIVIWGVGLGYLAYQFWEKSFRSANIYIFENRPEMVEYAREYGVLDWIDNDKLHINVNEDAHALFEEMINIKIDLNRAIIIISDWVIDTVGDDLRQQVLDFSENQKANARYTERYDVNYYCNIDKFIGLISELKNKQAEIDSERNNEYIVVAAGPSLNKEMDYLKSSVGKKTIIAVDGALKKLLSNDIKPDYVTAFDPNVTLMHYIEGIEEQTKDITLIADSVVYWKYLESFKGPKYRVMAADSKLNIIDKKELGLTDLGYHGTISGLAIEEAIYFGAKRIELIGLDLSFPGGKHYADGIGVDTGNKIDGGLEAVSVNGEMVSTSLTFDKFRREIEDQIAKHPEVEFVNLSNEGAFIKGTLCGRWYEKFPQNIYETKEYFEALLEDKLLNWKEKYYLFRKLINCNDINELKELSLLEMVFAKIVEAYKSEIGDVIGMRENNQQGEHLIYLITSHFSLFGDPVSDQLLKDAYKLQNEIGKNILIINTCEKQGGDKVVLRKNVDKKNFCLENVYGDEQLEEATGEVIVYLGSKIPYFKCTDNMPNIDYTRELIKFMKANITDGIIAYDEYSLFAKECEEIGLVEYRFRT